MVVFFNIITCSSYLQQARWVATFLKNSEKPRQPGYRPKILKAGKLSGR